MTMGGVRGREEICHSSQATQGVWGRGAGGGMGGSWHLLHLQAWRANDEVLFLGLILPFQKGFPKRQKQTEGVDKADIIQNKTSQRSRGRLGIHLLFHAGPSWTLGTFRSLTLWLIITMCVVAGSRPALGLPGELPGRPEGCTAAGVPRSSLEEQADVPTGRVLALG